MKTLLDKNRSSKRTFLPSGLLVPVSWTGFLIPVETVPGRMALLVTTFLMLVNLLVSEEGRNPRSCLAMVSAALFEYAVMLFLR